MMMIYFRDFTCLMLLGVYPQFQVVRAPAEVESVPGIVIEVVPSVEHLMIIQWM